MSIGCVRRSSVDLMRSLKGATYPRMLKIMFRDLVGVLRIVLVGRIRDVLIVGRNV